MPRPPIQDGIPGRLDQRRGTRLQACGGVLMAAIVLWMFDGDGVASWAEKRQGLGADTITSAADAVAGVLDWFGFDLPYRTMHDEMRDAEAARFPGTAPTSE